MNLLPLKNPFTVAAINAVVIPTEALHPELLPIVKWNGIFRIAYVIPLFHESLIYYNPLLTLWTERWSKLDIFYNLLFLTLDD